MPDVAGLCVDLKKDAWVCARGHPQRPEGSGSVHRRSGGVSRAGALTPIPAEQDVLELMRSHRAAGRSLAWIAQTLNDSSIPSRRSRWYPNSVRRALGEG